MQCQVAFVFSSVTDNLIISISLHRFHPLVEKHPLNLLNLLFLSLSFLNLLAFSVDFSYVVSIQRSVHSTVAYLPHSHSIRLCKTMCQSTPLGATSAMDLFFLNNKYKYNFFLKKK